MSTREDLGQIANEWNALQDVLARQPQTQNPVTGEESSSTALVGQVVIVGLRTARAYVTDPAPFWALGLGLLAVGILVVALAVKGATS
jgi:hypothetical protein